MYHCEQQRAGFRTDSSDAASHFDLLLPSESRRVTVRHSCVCFSGFSNQGNTHQHVCVFLVFPTVDGVVRKGIGAKYAQAYPLCFRAEKKPYLTKLVAVGVAARCGQLPHTRAMG